MSTYALKLKALRTQSILIIKSNWKYGVAFISGSFVSAICTLSFMKYITGKGIVRLLFDIFFQREQSKYRNIIKYNGFSKQFNDIRPSTQLIAFDSMIRSMAVKTPKTEYNKNMTKKQKINLIKQRRKEVKTWSDNMFCLPSFMSKPQKITINDDNELYGHLLCYPGCSISNGVIYYIHGGGLYSGDSSFGYPMLCIIQQYLGCCSFGIDYHLIPEICLPQQMDECIEGYKYILHTMNVDSNKIFIISESAGCAITCLLLQKLNKLNLPQPRGAILLSPDIDLTCKLAMDTESNDGIKDAMTDNYTERQLYKLCLDEEDAKQCNNDEDAEDAILRTNKYCALYGDWIGLCPLYVSSSLNEVLINNSKEIVNKCKEFNVAVEYEWDKYLLHTTAAMCSFIPEARDRLIVIIQWMKSQLKI